VLVNIEMLSTVPSGTVALTTANPMASWVRVAALFHPISGVRPGIHPSAVISDDAHVDGTVEVCAQAVIEAGADIRCTIGAGAVIGAGVVLGPDCRIGAHTSISHAYLGARVYVYPGARIGQEGFGFAITPQGFVGIPQLGSVIIGDDVEVGANTTIDRGALGDTVIGAGRARSSVEMGVLHAISTPQIEPPFMARNVVLRSGTWRAFHIELSR
jgi:UDP-3-O-[3-hydroxymyristoyl] glucosamine N-acyltransferase